MQKVRLQYKKKNIKIINRLESEKHLGMNEMNSGDDIRCKRNRQFVNT